METANTRAARWGCLRPVIVALLALTINLALDASVVAIVLQSLMGWPPLPMPPLAIIGQNCGHLYQGDWPGISGHVYDPDQGELCLWHAYSACHTATLIADFVEVDAGATVAITVRPSNGHCLVIARFQESKLGPWITGVIDQCAGLVLQRNGALLLRGCNAGDLALFPRPSEQVGHVCGILLNSNHTVVSIAPPYDAQTSVAEVEACFWRASRTCARPATLVYQVFVSDTTDTAGISNFSLTEHTLVVQPSRGACELTDAVIISSPPATTSKAHYTCASMRLDSDGSLIARGCGAEGQIIITSATGATQK